MPPVVTATPIKTVMLYATVDAFELSRGPGALALAITETIGGALTGVLANLDANVPPSKEGRSYAQMEEDFRLREQTNHRNAQDLQLEAERRGLDFEAVTEFDHSRGFLACIADRARLHDLVVVGADGAGMMSDRIIAQNLLFEIGRPMLVTPSDWAGAFRCTRIAVAWDNSRVAARALADALALFPSVEEVALLTIGGEKAIGSSLEDDTTTRILSRKGMATQVVHRELDGRSIGDALQQEAKALDTDMLVMGGYGHSRLRDFILGGATLGVVDNPQMPVLLSH